MEQSYTEANIYLVVYDTLEKEMVSIFVVVKSDKQHFAKMIEQGLQKMNAIKIHEMIFWHEGHIRKNPIFIQHNGEYDGEYALKIENLDQSFFVEEVLIFDVIFSNETDLIFHRKIILPKSINFELVEEEIRAMYYKVKEIHTILLTV